MEQKACALGVLPLHGCVAVQLAGSPERAWLCSAGCCLSGRPAAANTTGLFCLGEAGPGQLLSGAGWDV